jgi:hypothetical protein
MEAIGGEPRGRMKGEDEALEGGGSGQGLRVSHGVHPELRSTRGMVSGGASVCNGRKSMGAPSKLSPVKSGRVDWRLATGDVEIGPQRSAEGQVACGALGRALAIESGPGAERVETCGDAVVGIGDP